MSSYPRNGHSQISRNAHSRHNASLQQHHAVPTPSARQVDPIIAAAPSRESVDQHVAFLVRIGRIILPEDLAKNALAGWTSVKTVGTEADQLRRTGDRMQHSSFLQRRDDIRKVRVSDGLDGCGGHLPQGRPSRAEDRGGHIRRHGQNNEVKELGAYAGSVAQGELHPLRGWQHPHRLDAETHIQSAQQFLLHGVDAVGDDVMWLLMNESLVGDNVRGGEASQLRMRTSTDAGDHQQQVTFDIVQRQVDATQVVIEGLNLRIAEHQWTHEETADNKPTVAE
ncbi:FAD/NAD(P)-binding domain-containing protein [Aspergillus affinis]|uniref:FAD/NAD(P)-binding domain-containing protein n=1 Tax=Aspergillus affinis TaxID=1070780 RepID=UPI0022FEA46E|nr:FAD/NAD(P)-binding domain-containing protein [Aspergillus affinis]KAI9042588.1 FAD/NAD(P)-binding domain-containing protein [Aspergillus affinis]